MHNAILRNSRPKNTATDPQLNSNSMMQNSNSRNSGQNYSSSYAEDKKQDDDDFFDDSSSNEEDDDDDDEEEDEEVYDLDSILSSLGSDLHDLNTMKKSTSLILRKPILRIARGQDRTDKI